jgi:gamma-glutamyltranspeptidase
MALILASLPVNSPASLHLPIEAMRLHLPDAARYTADPAFVDVPIDFLLLRNTSRLGVR